MEEKDNKNERFARVFDELSHECPPCGFDAKIMSRIDERIKRRSLRKQWFYMLAMPCLGVAIIVAALYLIGRFTQFDFRISIPEIEFDPASMNLYIIPAVCTVLLLIADTLIRKRLDDKHRSDSK